VHPDRSLDINAERVAWANLEDRFKQILARPAPMVSSLSPVRPPSISKTSPASSTKLAALESTASASCRASNEACAMLENP
jgi:hypothetical protein